ITPRPPRSTLFPYTTLFRSETIDKNSPNIELLAPSSLRQGYFVELGFTGNETTGATPGPNTVWTVEGNNKLTPSTPVTLTFTNRSEEHTSELQSRENLVCRL